MKVMAIIPARSGSKGVPGKNIRLLGGYPLIAYSIVLARLVSKIDRVLVSTDSEEIAGVAREFGAETPFLRPGDLARDDSTDLEFVNQAIDWMEKYEGLIPDYLIHLRPTTPLRTPQIVSNAIEMIIALPEATSLRSGHSAPESPYKWFQRNEAGYFQGLFKNDDNDIINGPRQQFPEIYIPDGYVDILKPDYIMKDRKLHGRKMIGFISPFCTEIDTVGDFEWLEYYLQKKGSLLWDFLFENYPQRGKLNERF